MKNILLITLSILLFVSCDKKTDNLIAFSIDEIDIIPEGIAYSENTGNFYLGSINKNKILEIDSETGEYSDFIVFEKGLRVVGMIVDDNSGILWACANTDDENGQPLGTVYKIDIKSQKLIKRYIKNDTANLLLNDLVIDDIGNAYITNSSAQTIYKIDNTTNELIEWFDSPLITYPNGISISPDNKYLYIASWNKGIRVLDIDQKTLVGEADTIFNSLGLDGIKYYKNSIIGVQNSAPNLDKYRVIRYYLSSDRLGFSESKVIAVDNPYFDAPTTAVIRDNELFVIANSQLVAYNKDATLSDRSVLNTNIISSYVLKE